MGEHAIRAHLVHLLRSTRCNVIGGFDPARTAESHRGRLEEQGLAASFRSYAGFDALVGDHEVDAVVIASPDRFQLAQLRMAVEPGKHAWCRRSGVM
jgi:predicted dehydrogenase